MQFQRHLLKNKDGDLLFLASNNIDLFFCVKNLTFFIEFIII